MREQLFGSLAAVFQYPQEGWLEQVLGCREFVEQTTPAAAQYLDSVVDALCEKTTTQLEELFTQTFDHNPSHALEIGWHLFGEDYHRGALLVRLRQELRRHGIAETTELPDHLCQVLLLLGRMQPEEALSFAQACVAPALQKLIEGLERGKSPHLGLVQCVAAVIDHSCEHAFRENADGSHVAKA